MASGTNLWIIVLSVAVAVGILFLVPVLLELRRTARTLNSVLKITEDSLNPTLRELRATLENLDRITCDVSRVTDDVRVFTGSIRQVGKDIEELSGMVAAAGHTVSTNVSALRAGIGTGVAVLAKNLLKKGDKS